MKKKVDDRSSLSSSWEAPKKKKTTYHDLDKLAGTWSEKDKRTFEKNVKAFDKIDQELWPSLNSSSSL